MKLDSTLTCTAVADNVLLCGFNNGKVEMYDFKWKYFVSDNGGIFLWFKFPLFNTVHVFNTFDCIVFKQINDQMIFSFF